MIRLSEASARAVYRSLDVSQQGLAALAKKRSSVDRWSVRALYISFITSFFYVKSPEVVSWVLQQRSLVQGLFKELEKDAKHSILTLLAGLRHLAGREDIPRNDKLAVFSPHHLMILGNLYQFSDHVAQKLQAEAKKAQHIAKQKQQQQQQDGNAAGDDGESDKEPSSSSDSKETAGTGDSKQQQQQYKTQHDERNVADIVHALLLLLCTNTTAGLCFVPPSTHAAAVDWRQEWKSDTCANSSLQQFLVRLRSPALHAQPEELLIATCCAAPDVVPLVLTPAAFPIDDSLSLANLATMRLTFNVLRHPLPPMRHQMYACVEFRAASIVPPNIARSHMTKALKSSSALVVHTAVATLLAGLARLADDVDRTPQRDLAQAQRAEFTHALRVAVRRRLPPAQVLMQLYTRGHAAAPADAARGKKGSKGSKKSKRGKAGDKGQGDDDNDGVDGDGDNDNDNENAALQAPTQLADATLGLILRALGYYQRFFPDVFSTLDLGRLLPHPTTAATLSPLTLKQLFGVLHAAAGAINWLKPGAPNPNTTPGTPGTQEAQHGSEKQAEDQDSLPSKRAKKGKQAAADGSKDAAVEHDTRLHHVLAMHAEATSAGHPFSAGLLQAIFSHTGAFSGALMAELSAWWGSIPAHSQVVDVVVSTYAVILNEPLRTAEALLDVARTASAELVAPSSVPAKQKGKTSANASQSSGVAVDVSAMTYCLVTQTVKWCTAHADSVPACLLLAAFTADVLVRVMGTRASALLAFIAQRHFIDPCRKHAPHVEPVLALLADALQALIVRDSVQSATAAAAMRLLSSNDSAQHTGGSSKVGAGVSAKELASLSGDAVAEQVTLLVLRLSPHADDAHAIEATEAALTALVQAHDASKPAKHSSSLAALSISSAHVLASLILTASTSASALPASSTELLTSLCGTHAALYRQCLLPTIATPDNTAVQPLTTVPPLPSFSCSLDLVWAVRGLTVSIAAFMHQQQQHHHHQQQQQQQQGAEEVLGSGVRMSPELMWLRSRAEDVNQRVQAFARANISRPGAGVGATRALSLLHAVCVQQKQKQQQQQEEGGMQVAPQALMYALGCIYGNLVRLVHANRERSAHCASVLAGIVLPACLQRTWTPAQERGVGGGDADMPLNDIVAAVDFGGRSALPVAAVDVFRVLVLHVAAPAEAVRGLINSWLDWLLAHTPGATSSTNSTSVPSRQDVMFVQAMLASQARQGSSVLDAGAFDKMKRICTLATAAAIPTIDAIFAILQLSAPAHIGKGQSTIERGNLCGLWFVVCVMVCVVVCVVSRRCSFGQAHVFFLFPPIQPSARKPHTNTCTHMCKHTHTHIRARAYRVHRGLPVSGIRGCIRAQPAKEPCACADTRRPAEQRVRRGRPGRR